MSHDWKRSEPEGTDITQQELDALCQAEGRPRYPLDDLTPEDRDLILERRTL